MSSAWIDQRIPRIVVVTALLCCLTLSLAAEIQDDSRREAQGDAGQTLGDVGGKSMISDAVKKLADSPSYRWTTTVATGELGPFGGGGGVTAGQTEKGGFTRVAMPAAGRPEFVTRGGKTAILLDGNWQVSARQAARGGGPPGPPIGLEPQIIADFRLPAARASELIDKASAFHREGNTVTATLSPDVAAKLLEADLSSAPGRTSGSRPQPIRRPDHGSAWLRHVPGRRAAS